DDEEHLLLAAMAVERARALPRRDDVVRVAEVLRGEQRPDARALGFEFVALLQMLELELIDVDDFGIDRAHECVLRGKCGRLNEKTPRSPAGSMTLRQNAERLHALDDRRDALAAADAHRDEAVAAAGALE